MTDDLDGDDLDLSTLLDAHRAARDEELHTAFIGTVESYDATAQTADVKPMIQRAIARSDGTLAYEVLPTLRAVRVGWPCAGGWAITMPVSADDVVLVVCCERDPSGFFQTGRLSPPVDVRGHHLAHALAIPLGFNPRARVLSGVATDALELRHLQSGTKIRVTDSEVHIVGDTVRIGSTTASELVALASLVNQNNDLIASMFSTFVPGSGGAEFPNVYEPIDVSASKTRAE